MKFLVFLLVLIGLKTYSQNLEWAVTFGTYSSDEMVSAITQDASGNIYITGRFSSTADFDPSPNVFNLTSNGWRDVFIAKYTSTGGFVWAKSIGGPFNDSGTGIGINQEGNLVVFGGFYDVVDFDPNGGVHLMSAGSGLGQGYNSFLLCLDTSGSFLWSKNIGSANSIESVIDMDFDQNHNICLTGQFNGVDVDFDPGPDTVVMLGNMDVFILKLDSAGNFIWVKSFGEAYHEEDSFAIITDSSNNIYITGFFEDSTDIDPSNSVHMIYGSDNDSYTLKLDESGSFIWVTTLKSHTDNMGYEMTIDSDQNIYTSGVYYWDTLYGISTLDTLFVPPYNGQDVYIQKLNPYGDIIWLKGFGSYYGSSDMYDHILDIECQDSSLYITGTNGGWIDFDPDTTSQFILYGNATSGEGDIFVAKFDTSGTFRWANGFYGTDENCGMDLLVSSSNEVFLAGIFTGSIDADPTSDTLWFTGSYGNAGADVLLLKIGNCDSITIPSTIDSVTINSTSCCSNDSLVITVYGQLNDDDSWIAVIDSCNGIVANSSQSNQLYVAPQDTTTFYITTDAKCNPAPTCHTITCYSIPISYNTINVSTCNNYTVPSGNTTYYSSGVYSDTLINFLGCDSIISIQLDIQNSSDTFDLIVCDSLISPSGNQVYYSNGTYLDTIPNSLGCDSLITLNLTIISIDTSIVYDGSGSLSSLAEPTSSFQWVDCDDNYSVISNETNQEFIPTSNGSYAVIIDNSGCIDTSKCLQVYDVSLAAYPNSKLSIGPNPSSGVFHITFQPPYLITIFDISGNIVYKSIESNSIQMTIELTCSPGLYLLKASNSDCFEQVLIQVIN